jgi:hypothetical protein
VKYSIRIRALQPSSSQESGNGISVLAWKFIFVEDIALFFLTHLSYLIFELIKITYTNK